ncbi:MAG: RidA family protein [Candidatus Marinimicrobia bacterium]|nr:RidA family protein [Candidatus Neomarinimicrobiota bacterium]
MRKMTVTAGITLLCFACSGGGQGGRNVEYLQSEAFAGQNLPFSEAVRVGNMLYLSGQVGNRPGSLEVVEGGIGPETQQTMENIKDVLERYGSSLDEVVKCTCMLTDISEWGDMSKVYAEFFPDRKPARSAFAGTGLALGAKVEIECWATVD